MLRFKCTLLLFCPRRAACWTRICFWIRRYQRDETPLRDLLFVLFSSSSAIGYISVIGSGCYGRNAEDCCLLVTKCAAPPGRPLLDDRTPPTRVSSYSGTRFSRSSVRVGRVLFGGSPHPPDDRTRSGRTWRVCVCAGGC